MDISLARVDMRSSLVLNTKPTDSVALYFGGGESGLGWSEDAP
jgi:hypothetical protein